MADDAVKSDDKDDKNGKDAGKPPEIPPPAHFDEKVVETSHQITIAGETIRYVATAGRLLLQEEEGKKKASFFYVAYTRELEGDPSVRPIVFCFNGGPGSSSVWLH